ncbi:MAG: DUF4065 domain-containing protein [Proteobacteria bacterium]|nr:DUF4065 domain-containing protein [Pseudomonadota bacterium]
MYDSRTIANRFLELASTSNDTLTSMQLLKLVYMAHGWMLGLYHRPLIKDEVQAWQYGPVIPRLYNAIRHFKGSAVSGPIKSDKEALDEFAQNIIEQVYERYGRLSGPALSRLTHAADSPWEVVYEPGSFGLVIPDDLIEDYYARLSARPA